MHSTEETDFMGTKGVVWQSNRDDGDEYRIAYVKAYPTYVVPEETGAKVTPALAIRMRQDNWVGETIMTPTEARAFASYLNLAADRLEAGTEIIQESVAKALGKLRA